MTEMEAHSIAEAIRGAALKAVHVEAVEQDPKTSKFQVKCRYHGPTFKHREQLILNGMHLWIKRPYDWATLYKLLKKT